jgi:hypothetical protein
MATGIRGGGRTDPATQVLKDHQRARLYPADARHHEPIRNATLSPEGQQRLTAAEAHRRELARVGLTPDDVVNLTPEQLGVKAYDHQQAQRKTHMARAEAGLVPGFFAPPSILDRFFAEGLGTTLGLPGGIVETGKSVGQDVGQVVHGHAPTHTLENVLKPIGSSIAQQAEHPIRYTNEHPFLSVLNLGAAAGATAGAVGRVGAIGEVAAARTPVDLAAAYKALPAADRGAYNVLANPARHLGRLDTHTAHRIVKPSNQLDALLHHDPHLAATRKAIVDKLGSGDLAPHDVSVLGAPARVVRIAGATPAGQLVKAAVKRPEPAQRTRILPGEGGAALRPGELGPVHPRAGFEVHPVGSKNLAVNVLQQLFDRRANARIGGKPLSDTLGVNVPRSFATTETRIDRLASPEAAIGRELRARRAVENALAAAPAARLEKFGATRPARVIAASTGGRIDVARVVGRPGRRLSAAEQKAVDIVASGATASEHVAEHALNLQRGVGEATDHVRQIRLAQAAARHLENPRPELTAAISLARDVTGKREQVLGMTADESAHRVGARLSEIRESAAGANETPLQELARLKDEIAASPAKGTAPRDLGAAVARARQNVAAIEAKTIARERHLGKRGARTDGILVNLNREGAALKERLYVLERQQRMADIHAGFVREGHQAREAGAFYVPSKSLRDVRGPGQPGVTAGPYGAAPPRELPELHHAYTGALERTGNYRTDATGLVADGYRRAQGFAAAKRGFEQLRAGSHATRTAAGGERFAIPIRETFTIPPDLKAVIAKADAGTLTAEDLKAFTSTDAEQLIAHLFPTTPDAIKGARWIDSRVVAGFHRDVRDHSVLGKGFDAVNAPLRAGLLYTKPAYALNFVQALGTHIIESGPFAARNMVAALRLGRTLGAEDQHAVFAIMGEGLSRSFEAEAGLGLKAIRAAGEFWNVAVDRYPRVAAFLHEARHAGFDTPEKLHALLNDAELRTKLVDVTRRANREAIDYGTLSPFERNVVKRALFFYPWIRGATLYSLRFPLEHPVQAAAVGQLGEIGRRKHATLGRLPISMEGLIPLTGGAKPRVVDLTNLNTFATPVEMIQAFAGLAQPSRNPSASALQGELGPVAGALGTLLFGKTAQGYDVPGATSRIGAAKERLLDILPPATFQRRLKANPKSAFEHGLGTAIGGYMAGGTYPRGLDKAIANEQGEKEYRRSLAPLDRYTYDSRVAIKEARADAQRLAQLGVLPSPILPRDVARAIRLDSSRSVEEYKLAQSLGVKVADLTSVQKGVAMVTAAQSAKAVKPSVANTALRMFGSASGSSLKSLLREFWAQYGLGDTLSTWRTYTNHYLNAET